MSRTGAPPTPLARQAKDGLRKTTRRQIPSGILPFLGSCCGDRPRTARLFAQTKTFNNLAVPIRVTAVEVVQQAPALVDHHDQAAPRCMVLHVGLEMRRQVVDPFTQ